MRESNDATVVASFVLDEPTMRETIREIVRAAGPQARLAPWLGAVSLLCLAYLTWYTGLPFWYGLPLPLFFFVVPQMVRWIGLRSFKASSAVGQAVTWTFTPEGTEVVLPHSASQVNWEAFIRARESEKGLILFHQPRLANWIPKTACKTPQELEQVRSWLAAKGKLKTGTR